MTGTLLGSFFQYVLLRVFSRSHYKSGSFLLSSLASCGSQGLRASLRMLLQACMTSGMLQIASSTDTFFASFLPHAAAGTLKNRWSYLALHSQDTCSRYRVFEFAR
mmetsp:Transcript_14613/g.52596  ORF Transcript_14613/g.52596 Transcript_14613/m.52596 type:complete len:106 (-) Transcript_14613:1928-2245(-)